MVAEIRSVQKVAGSLTGIDTLFTIPTALLDISKAFMLLSYRIDNTQCEPQMVYGEIDSTTEFRIRRQSSFGTVSFVVYIVEFLSGVSVQRGSPSVSGNNDIALGAIDLSKSWVNLIGLGRKSGGASLDREFASAYLWDDGGTPTVRLKTSVAGNLIQNVSYEVIEIDGAVVQRGSVTGMTSSETSQMAALSPSVDLDRTFLRHTHVNGPGTANNIGQKMIRGRFVSDSQISFDRSNTGVAIDDIRWEAITLPPSMAVQAVSSSFSNGQSAPNNESIVDVSDLERAAAIASSYGFLGSSPMSSGDRIGPAACTIDLIAEDSLQLTRDRTEAAILEAYVLDFDAISVGGGAALEMGL